jgi:VanZ family protein
VLAIAHDVRRVGGGMGWRAGLIVIAGASLLSLSVETAQLCMDGRVSSSADWFANTAGAAFGWMAGRLSLPAWRIFSVGIGGGVENRRLLAVVMLAVFCWSIASTAPWWLTSDAGLLRQNVSRLWFAIGTGYLDPWRLAQHFGAWLAVGLSLSLAIRRPSWAFTAFAGIAMTVVVARLLIRGAQPSVEWMLSLPVAWFMVGAIVASVARSARAALTIAAVLLAMTAYELRPAYGMLRGFGWSIGLLRGDPIFAIQLGAFISWYAVTMVAAGRAAGGRAGTWALLATASIALMEWAQIAVPGRTPDLSPILLTIVTGWAAARILTPQRAPSIEPLRDVPNLGNR